MQKVDHVRNSQRVGKLAVELRNIAREERLPLLRALAGQLKEEQEHNDYYRKMLEIHGIDHEAYYTAFETYLNRIPIGERDHLTYEVLTALMEARTPDAFPNAPFPQPILAICHYLMGAATDPEVKFLIYLALQSGIEFALVKAISESVFPGVAGTRDRLQLNPELVPDADVAEAGTVPLSIKWFDEHADYGQGGKAELRHVKHGREQLNRKLVELEQQGADVFLGEPEFDIHDLLRVIPDGKGMISVLSLTDIQDRPALFSTFMMWLLGELFHQLPERGDVDKPVLVFFFDEAHLLFKEASKALLNQIEQVVKLIRSKGVGVYFVTQTPKDIPADVLAQLGNRFEHALRAFTPDDAKALKATAGTFPRTPFYDIEKELTSLGIGEALVTVLDAQGRPTPVVATRLLPPDSIMDTLEHTDLEAAVRAGSLQGKYARSIDRESAREILQKKMTTPVAAGSPAPADDLGGPDWKDSAASVAKDILKSPLTRQIGREVVRGIFGMLKKNLK